MHTRKEYQVKVKGLLSPAHLLEFGAEPLGTCNQQDIYMNGNSTRRVRIEGDTLFFAEKGHDLGEFCRIREVTDEVIPRKDADALTQQSGVKAMVCKTRSLFRLQGAVVALDEVEQLGPFSEIRAESEDKLLEILERIGVKLEDSLKTSYLDMMLEKQLPEWHKALIRFHDRMGELTFGITSGVLTTVGVLVGVNSAAASRLAVIASIVAVAMADSWSDAFGMFNSKMAERGASRTQALRFAAATLTAKMLVPLTFILPLAALELSTAVIVCLVWGAVLLALLSAEQALVSQQSVRNMVARNLGLAMFIMLISKTAGHLIGWMFG